MKVKAQFSIILILALTLCFQPTVMGQEAESPKYARPYTHAIHAFPISYVFGNFNLGYEYLHHQMHGFEVSGSLLTGWGKRDSKSLSLNYKKYRVWNNAYRFWGIFLDYFDLNESFTYDNTDFKYNISGISFGPNIGMKWVWNSGFCVTCRLGYGIPITSFIWDGEQPEDDIANLLKGIIKFGAGVDGELKIGWCF